MDVKPSEESVVISIKDDDTADATADNKNGKFTSPVETCRYVELS